MFSSLQLLTNKTLFIDVATIDEWTLDGLLEDRRMEMGVKLEDYLLVHLGVRPCAQITIPAELPNGGKMGEEIDDRIGPYLLRLRSMGVADRRREIKRIKREMQRAFREIVWDSQEYKAHLEWASRLGLKIFSHEVRPTVWEIYIFDEGKTGRRLKRLMKEREKLRRKTLRRPRGFDIYLAYPEELDARWVREMGLLLGYPRCCVDRYSNDRRGGVNLEERAVRQIEEAGRKGGVNPFVYFVRYFFPCRPECPAAVSLGERCHTLLSQMDERLGDLYLRRVKENLLHVRRQLELIDEYRERVRCRWTSAYSVDDLDSHRDS